MKRKISNTSLILKKFRNMNFCPFTYPYLYILLFLFIILCFLSYRWHRLEWDYHLEVLHPHQEGTSCITATGTGPPACLHLHCTTCSRIEVAVLVTMEEVTITCRFRTAREDNIMSCVGCLYNRWIIHTSKFKVCITLFSFRSIAFCFLLLWINIFLRTWTSKFIFFKSHSNEPIWSSPTPNICRICHGQPTPFHGPRHFKRPSQPPSIWNRRCSSSAQQFWPNHG